MEDADVADTPRTMSLAPSDSQGASEESTRASTPTENRAEDAAADVNFLDPFGKDGVADDVADDVTMKDVGVEKKSPADTANELGNLKVVSWPSSTVIDPGSSPGKPRRTEHETVDYASDPQKLEELLRVNDGNSPNVYKP